MRIVDLLRKESIHLNGKASDKMDVIDEMVSLMEKGGHLSDVGIYKEAVLKREAEGTTGIGEGIAIPHAKTNAARMKKAEQLLRETKVQTLILWTDIRCVWCL